MESRDNDVSKIEESVLHTPFFRYQVEPFSSSRPRISTRLNVIALAITQHVYHELDHRACLMCDEPLWESQRFVIFSTEAFPIMDILNTLLALADPAQVSATSSSRRAASYDPPRSALSKRTAT